MKSQIRGEVLKLRKSVSKKDEFMKNNKVFVNFKPFFSKENMFLYVSKEDEVDTNAIMQFFFLNKRVFFVPFIKGDKIFFSQISSTSQLEKGTFNIFEPKQKIPTEEKPDIVIVPGVAFDRKGNRLGRGKGYYDKFLKNVSCLKIGLTFDFQILDIIPIDDWDVPVDIIITEKEIIDCRKNR